MKTITLITATLLSLTLATGAFASDSTLGWTSVSANLEQLVERKLNQQVQQASFRQVVQQSFRYEAGNNKGRIS